jgi:hypothetical protein
VIFMRGVQVLLWILTFWLANRLMARLGAGQFARWATIAIAVCSQVLMIPAVEYRVDVLGCTLYLGGLFLLVNSHDPHPLLRSALSRLRERAARSAGEGRRFALIRPSGTFFRKREKAIYFAFL